MPEISRAGWRNDLITRFSSARARFDSVCESLEAKTRSTKPDVENGLAEHVLDAVEQVALVLLFALRTRGKLLLGQRFRQLFEKRALLLRQLLWRLDLHGGEKVSPPAAADGRHALAAQP